MDISRLDVIKNKYKTTVNYRDFLLNQLLSKQKEKDVLSAEYADLLTQIEIDKKATEVIKVLTERVSSSGLIFLQELVSRGLQTIFTDDVYSFCIEMSERGSAKVVQFFIVDSRGSKVPLEDCGGGIQVIVSFIVRVYMIVKLKLYRFIVLDESFSQVSSQYAEGLMAFLTSMSEQLGFKILFVSHSESLLTTIGKKFNVSHGSVKLIGG